MQYDLDCSATLDCSKLAVIRIGYAHAPLTWTVHGGVWVPLSAAQGTNLVLGQHGCSTVAMPPIPVPTELVYVGLPFSIQGLCGDTPNGYTSIAYHGRISALPMK